MEVNIFSYRIITFGDHCAARCRAKDGHDWRGIEAEWGVFDQ